MRSEGKNCNECTVWEENPPDFAEQICSECGANIVNPYLDYLLYYLTLQDAGCPIERHELTNEQWIDMLLVKSERNKFYREEHEQKHKPKVMNGTHKHK